MKALNEFGVIRRFFVRPQAEAGAGDGVVLGVGDDAAILRPNPAMDLVVAVDTLVDGVHFPRDMAPSDIAWRTLATNLSDLAAMGATPRWFTLALSLPSVDEQWLEGFSDGLFALARQSSITLVGGDTTRGPLTISITVHGELEQGTGLTRRGAQPGDNVYITGAPGIAALGLQQWEATSFDAAARERFCRPVPRLSFGQQLRGLATAAIDVSDGLLADAGHIAHQSSVGIVLNSAQIPLASALMALGEQQALALALGGGDDYELCFTAPACAHDSIMKIAQNEGLDCTLIGEVTDGSGIRCAGASITVSGYDHFGGA